MRKYTRYKLGKYKHLKVSIPTNDSSGEYVYEAVHMTASNLDVAASAVVRKAVYHYVNTIYGKDNAMVLRWMNGKQDG